MCLLENSIPFNFTVYFISIRPQLLIPLSITQEEPELALTLEKNDEGTVYIARTCLTLEMAYNNARQLMKPVQAWIYKLVYL
ncbi:DUF3825 domain-containing protein [Listeria booriae]|uniref:DUF3825 domain-containing protein n=1 Tax=Listeria booriae TaxID=1552123 RepID=UPI00162786F3|nr:DUF3825 domain-containing protein [Listeria booriae]